MEGEGGAVSAADAPSTTLGMTMDERSYLVILSCGASLRATLTGARPGIRHIGGQFSGGPGMLRIPEG